METSVKSIHGMELIGRLLAVKKQAQIEAQENHRNNPEVGAVHERLIQKNKAKRIGKE